MMAHDCVTISDYMGNESRFSYNRDGSWLSECELYTFHPYSNHLLRPKEDWSMDRYYYIADIYGLQAKKVMYLFMFSAQL